MPSEAPHPEHAIKPHELLIMFCLALMLPGLLTYLR